jgi:hypothetical protein
MTSEEQTESLEILRYILKCCSCELFEENYLRTAHSLGRLTQMLNDHINKLNEEECYGQCENDFCDN